MTDKIRYRDGYKYQLVDPYGYQTELKLDKAYHIDSYILLTETGLLYIYRTYAWDGPSGPTYDSKNSIRASLVHDAFYQLFRAYPELLVHREYADSLLYKICREDGMWPFRAYLWQKGVNWFGKSAATAKDEILEAP